MIGMLVLAIISITNLICQLYSIWQMPLLVVAVLLAFRFEPWRSPIWLWTSKRLSSLSLNRSILLVGILGLLAAMTTGLAGRTPLPAVHDEYSYLLAEDTFAHGRLTNPTHPMWEFFETFHVIQHPTYMSKYPPGMGLVLAMGEVLAGIPLVGVWITMGLASGAAVWMLGAYVPKRWAILGGLLVALHPLMGHWSLSFWGASLASLGGILVTGAVGYIRRQPGMLNGILLGVGTSILAISRPAEGLILCVVSGGFLLAQLWKASPRPWRDTIVKAGIPATIIIGISGLWLGYYNYRVTGDWKTLPYLLCAQQYEVYPPFIFQEPAPPPSYNHPVMEQFYLNHAGVEYREAHLGLYGLFLHCIHQLNTIIGALPTPLALAAFPLVLLMRSRKGDDLALLVALGVFAAVLCLETWRVPIYGAPALGLVIVLICRGIRNVNCWRFGPWHGGRCLVWGVLAVVALAMVITRISALPDERQAPNPRGELIADLLAVPGKHLVLVRYAANYSPYGEWVYNGADVDGSTIVFARDMGIQKNRRLLEYFQDRQVWLVSVSKDEVNVESYGQARGTP